MPILRTYVVGLAVAHLAWFYFFTTGQLLRRRRSDEWDAFCLADMIVASAAGLATAGFGLLLLGFIHFLNIFGIFSALVAEGVLFYYLRGDNWFSWTFWRATLQRFISAWTLPAFSIYLLFLILALPAVLPPTSSDAITYHLAYAVDWANAGRIYVDQFMRFPYYANNFLLVYTALFLLKLGNYCHFLNWLCGLLTCLGVLAFFTPAKTQPQPASQRFDPERLQPQQFLIPLCVALSPIFLRWLNVAILDVPIGLFILVPILCAYRTLLGQRFERELVVTAAFCVGMKLTLIGHLPFFVISLAVVSAYNLQPRRTILLCLALLALSLPWYLRNFIDTGDPTPPIFNFHLHRPDPIFTRTDSEIYTAHSITQRDPLHLLLLPFRFYTHPESANFREDAVSAAILFMYAPILFLFALPFVKKWSSPQGISYVSVSVVYLLFPWLVSSQGRHSLHWYPVLAAWIGIVISQVYTRVLAMARLPLQRWATYISTTAFCCVLIYPTPTRALSFYGNCHTTIASLFRPDYNPQQYLNRNLSGYLASQAVIETLVCNQREDTRVLSCPPLAIHYYYRKAKIVSIGDFFGPARYSDLYRAIAMGDCLSYLARFDVAVVVVPSTGVAWWPSLYNKFRTQLKEYGFTEYRCLEHNVAIFLRRDIHPGQQLIPLTQ